MTEKTNYPPKIAVVTTFPTSAWDDYAKECLESFLKHWPQEIDLFVVVDQDFEDKFNSLDDMLRDNDKIMYRSKEMVEFSKKEHPAYKDDSYRGNLVGFAHKIFAIDLVRKSTGFDYDYLIWYDADISTFTNIPSSCVIAWLPDNDQVASFLGRRVNTHSECGFVAYNMKDPAMGPALISRMIEIYTSGQIYNLSEWHDSFLFDHVRKEMEAAKSSFKNLTHKSTSFNVFLDSPLARYMEHWKGPIAKQRKKPLTDSEMFEMKSPKADQNAKERTPPEGKVFLEVTSKNCVDHKMIREHVRQNLEIIKNWVGFSRKTNVNCVMCAAGDSLSIAQIAKHATHPRKEGEFIVAVKHAYEKMVPMGFSPDAIVLLDPRPHVYNFVENVDKTIIYLVASMVDPKVTRHLVDSGAIVMGYHAPVGADEHIYYPEGSPLISKGTSASIRGIELMQVLGFENFDLYGYDLCYFQKPDLKEKLPNGSEKYIEMDVSVTDGEKNFVRTLWTKLEFVSQIQEFEKFYLKDYNIKVHGDGVLAWMRRCQEKLDLRNEYIFNRNPYFFDRIMNATQSGKHSAPVG